MGEKRLPWRGRYRHKALGQALVQCALMQHMRNGAIILAVLLTATPTLAAEQCLEVKPDSNIPPGMEPTYAKYADTSHCFLRIDGKVVINRTCHIYISPQLR